MKMEFSFVARVLCICVVCCNDGFFFYWVYYTPIEYVDVNILDNFCIFCCIKKSVARVNRDDLCEFIVVCFVYWVVDL